VFDFIVLVIEIR